MEHTALTFTPAWTDASGASVPNFVPYLKTVGETCLTDVILSFDANGAATVNNATTASCNNAPQSKIFLDYLFESGSTFTETISR